MIDPLYYDLDNYRVEFIGIDYYTHFTDRYAQHPAKQRENYHRIVVEQVYEKGEVDTFFALKCKGQVVKVWAITEDSKSSFIRLSRALHVSTPEKTLIPGLTGHLIPYFMSQVYNDCNGMWYTSAHGDRTIASIATDRSFNLKLLARQSHYSHTSLYKMAESIIPHHRYPHPVMIRDTEQILGYAFFHNPGKYYVTTDDHGNKVYTE